MARRSAQAATQLPVRSHSSVSDVEAEESQRVVALNSLLRTPKPNNKELQTFKIKVATDQQELKALLEQRKRQAEDASTRRRNELTRTILDTLQSPNRSVQGAAPTLGETKIARNAILKIIGEVLNASQQLIGEYDRLNEMIVGIWDAEPEGVAEAWTEDVEKTARLLKVGAATAFRNMKMVLGADVEADNVVEEGSERMDAVETMELNYELQKSLQYAERGVKKMVKGLPQDEGHQDD